MIKNIYYVVFNNGNAMRVNRQDALTLQKFKEKYGISKIEVNCQLLYEDEYFYGCVADSIFCDFTDELIKD